jgi:hypothetical protein
MVKSSHDVDEITDIRQAYNGATELLVRVANALENGLLYSAKKDGPTALGLAGWLLSGLSERVRVSEAAKLVLAFTVLVEEDISSQSICNGVRALHMGAQLVNTLSGSPGVAGQIYIRIRDDLICWSDHVEMNDFPHRNNGPEALRLAADLLKLTTCLT